MHLLRFPGLSLTDKLRTGAVAAFCKLYPFWQPLENVTAKKFFKTVGGAKAWDIIWEPLMTGKFGHFDSTIAASWLWARINKRTPSLCYIEGGFQTFIETLADHVKKQGGTIHMGITISTIQQYNNATIDRSDDKKQIPQFCITVGKQQLRFDRILLTVPTPVAYKLIPAIREDGPLTIPHLHAQVLVLETKEPILENIYWLNITDRSFPFLAVVAHTNFMDKKHYGGHHLTYVGNYLPEGHPYLSITKDKLLKKFAPYIKRLTLNSKLSILNSYVFFGPYAQPVQQLHYSKKAPKLKTPIPGVYLANMDSIYPWDRGTNYAVDLGQKAAQVMSSH
jgi:protoporphyrinogen oxidase